MSKKNNFSLCITMQKIRDLHVVGDVKVAKLLRKLTNVKVGSSKNTVLNL